MKTYLAHGAIYLTFSSVIFLISGYVINIWLGRYLGAEIYGIYGIIISLVTVINLTQTAGLPQAVSKYVASDKNQSEEIYKTGFIIQIISTTFISLLFFLFSGALANLLKDSTLTPYLQLAAFIFPLYGLFALLTGYYNGLHLFGKQAFLHIIYSLVKVITIIALAYFFHLYGVILGFIISPIIALLVRFHTPRNDSPDFAKASSGKATEWYKKLILFSFPLIGVAIAANLLQSIDLFFVKALTHSNSSAGFYTANQNIAEIPFFALSALSSVLFPSISKHLSQNMHGEARILIKKSLRFCLLVLTPGVLLISATSNIVLSLLFSKAFYPGAPSLSILVIGSGFFTLFVILTTIISSAGSPTKSALLAGLGVIISSILCILFIPRYGLNGAALSTTIAAGIVMCGAGIMVYRKFHVLFNLKSVVKILLASFLIYFLARIIPIPTLLLPLLYIFLFGIYIALLFLLKEITDEDVALVKSLLPKRLILDTSQTRLRKPE